MNTMKVNKVAFYGKSIYNWVEKDIFAFKGASGAHSMLVQHAEVMVRSNECFQTKGFILWVSGILVGEALITFTGKFSFDYKYGSVQGFFNKECVSCPSPSAVCSEVPLEAISLLTETQLSQ